ncbi:hypothetical protein PVV74_17440 [Roseovarius sp. SK2]|uniref:hypothetical protein n=1 Tax=Roseovarius TaxID=74030 RepID=UPI00237B437C|nr:hypothetical protein [Roseovarius sp. SK2]MDD9727247.1 hypothetical protein [Roseovarius sp. SK2]
MKLATFLAAFLVASPLWAFEKHELDLGPPDYNRETGLTGYKVENGPCFTSQLEHKTYAESKGLQLVKIFPAMPGVTILIFTNADDTYREVYAIHQGKGCLVAVGYVEGEAL